MSIHGYAPRLRAGAACLAAALLLAGCASAGAPGGGASSGAASSGGGATSGSGASVSKTDPQGEELRCGQQTYQKTFQYDDGGTYFDLSIALPCTEQTGPAADAINSYYAQRLEELRENYTDYADETRKSLPPETAAECYVSIDSAPEFESGRLVTFSVCEEGYGGGVHGWYTVAYDTFDLSDGAQVTLGDLFTDAAAGVAAVRREVLRQIGETPMEDVSEEDRQMLRKEHQELAAKLFDEPTFQRGNFWLNGDGVGIHFNAYDIASYAEGASDYTVPYGLLDGLLRPELLEDAA